MTRNVLMIVEGEKADYKLMEHLLQLFFEAKFYIVPYKTNIYALYDMFKMNDLDDFEALDTVQVLKSVQSDEQIRKELDKNFSDIILVFDFDPQDPNYSAEKILKLKSIFKESTDNGKLYLNYPMVEAFKHLSSVDDPNYLSLKVLYEDLKEKRYKQIVSDYTFQTDYKKFDRKECLAVFRQNIVKANYILYGVNALPSCEEEYFKIDLDEILNIQCKLLNDDRNFYVLCTCIFFLLDNKPKALLNEIENLHNTLIPSGGIEGGKGKI